METLSRREFLQAAAATGVVAIAPAVTSGQASQGFRGPLCFFSKHLPRMNGRELGRTLKSLGFTGVDLTVRPGGHIDPTRVAELLPPFVDAVRGEGVAVPMITTEILSAANPVAAPTFATAARLKIPYLKPGYYRYAFADVRAELAATRDQLRTVADLASQHGVVVGFHNHAGYIGGTIWDVAPIIDSLDAKAVGYYFDIRHAVIEGGDGGWRSAFNLVAPRLKMIAIKDAYWEKTPKGWVQRNCPLGEGMVNWKAYFALLAKARFHGVLSLHLEYEVGGDTEAAREERTIAAATRDFLFLKTQLAAAYAGGATA